MLKSILLLYKMHLFLKKKLHDSPQNKKVNSFQYTIQHFQTQNLYEISNLTLEKSILRYLKSWELKLETLH